MATEDECPHPSVKSTIYIIFREPHRGLSSLEVSTEFELVLLHSNTETTGLSDHSRTTFSMTTLVTFKSKIMKIDVEHIPTT